MATTWWDQARKHISLISPKNFIHIRAYGDWGGKKLYVPAMWGWDQIYIEIGRFMAKHNLSNFSIAIADRIWDNEEDDSVGKSEVVVFDLDRTKKDSSDSFLARVRKETASFLTYLEVSGFKQFSVLRSGTGYHVYFKVDPYDIRSIYNDLSRKLLEIWNMFDDSLEPQAITLDSGLHFKKVMRLAGSYNRKLGYPVMAKWVYYRDVVDDKMNNIVRGVADGR